MLVLTQNATAVIREILDSSTLPDSSGLRITRSPEGDANLSVHTADTAEAGDQVIEEEGLRVFLGPQAAAALDDKVLDANVDTGGQVRFLISPQQ